MKKLNAEHYPDHTAWDAIAKVEREIKPCGYRPVIYICSPFAGNREANVRKAREYCRFAVRRRYIPIAPHLLFPQFLKDEILAERRLAIFMNLVLLAKCQEVWVFGNKITEGMAIEIAKARYKRIRIRYFTDNFEEVERND